MLGACTMTGHSWISWDIPQADYIIGIFFGDCTRVAAEAVPGHVVNGRLEIECSM